MYQSRRCTQDYPDLDQFNRVAKSRWTKDLTTDRDFYHVELSYDRNSEIISAQDTVHAGMDVAYTMDHVNRVTEAKEGTLSGGAITSTTRDEQWTLSHAGDWTYDKVDLNGDGDFVDTGELNDHRTYDKVNQLTARDTDNNGTNNYTLTYDGAGDLTSDGKEYKYVYDAFLRLRKVKTQAGALVAEYRYNGLGHRIAVHEDTNSDGAVDSLDKWYYDAFDDQWRILARYRESDSSPKEDFVPHQAGLDGNGSGSYIDLVVCRNKDANTAWTSASDGTLEERRYYCQNWRGDVSAIVTSSGAMKEWDKYSAYGIPFGLPAGDANSDGACNSADVLQIQTWISGGQYDVRGDLDLDGDVDLTDKSLASGMSGTTLGRGTLSAGAVSSRRGYSGLERLTSNGTQYIARRRVFGSSLGIWLERDPRGGAASNQYEYTDSDPIDLGDAFGLTGDSFIEQIKSGIRYAKDFVDPARPQEPDGYGGYMGKNERDVYKSLSFGESICYRLATYEALRAAYGYKEPLSSQRKHCMWSCGLVPCVGTAKAQLLVVAHEIDDPNDSTQGIDLEADNEGFKCRSSIDEVSWWQRLIDPSAPSCMDCCRDKYPSMAAAPSPGPAGPLGPATGAPGPRGPGGPGTGGQQGGGASGPGSGSGTGNPRQPKGGGGGAAGGTAGGVPTGPKPVGPSTGYCWVLLPNGCWYNTCTGVIANCPETNKRTGGVPTCPGCSGANARRF